MEQKLPLEILIDAKLAGTTEELLAFDYSAGGVRVRPFTYTFRSNEQAAALAVRALEEAGYKIVPSKRTIVENLDKDGNIIPKFRIAEVIKDLPTGDRRIYCSVHDSEWPLNETVCFNATDGRPCIIKQFK